MVTQPGAPPQRHLARSASHLGLLGILLGTLLSSLSACFFYDSSWGQAKVAQQNAAQHYSGAQLGDAKATTHRLPPRQPELRRLKIIAFATREHAVQVVNWQARFREAVERANQLLGPALSIELEVVDGGFWRPEGENDSLDALLSELERTHSGITGDWVVGLVGSLRRLESSIHQLGIARLHGKHMVLRATARERGAQKAPTNINSAESGPTRGASTPAMA